MKTKLMMCCLTVACYGAFAQHDHHAQATAKQETATVKFKDAKLGIAYSKYIAVKDALVASNTAEAKSKALELQKLLKDVSESKAALEAVVLFTNAPDLAEQRLAFSTVSNEMATLVKGGKLSEGTLYLEYCPMANSNEGAYWLSNEKAIKNPYFGDKMLKCGSVKETIQ